MAEVIGAGPFNPSIAVSAGWAIAADLLPGYTHHHVIGYNPSIGAAFTDLSELGVAVIPLPSSAIAMEVVSTSVADASAGTGAQTVEVHGLESNWDEANEIVTLNGTTPVDLTGTYIRINNIHVQTVGSGGVAAGDITLQADGAGTAYARVAAGGNMMFQCHFTVPAGKTAYISEWSAGSAGNKAIRFMLCAKSDWDDSSLTTVYHCDNIITQLNGTSNIVLDIPIKLPAMCDAKISARIIGAGTGEGSGEFCIFYK